MAGHNPCCFCLTCSDGDGRAPAELQVDIADITSPGSGCLCDATCGDLNGTYIVARDTESVTTDGLGHRHCITTYVYTYDWLCDMTGCTPATFHCYPTIRVKLDYDEDADSTAIEVILYYGYSLFGDDEDMPCNANTHWTKWTETVAGRLECATLDQAINDVHTNSVQICTTGSATCNLSAAP